jgi:tetratricopeptide (TPR) repeat protein
VAHFEQALEALAHLPETRATLEQAIDLRFDLRNSLVPLGALDTVLEHLREAERLARSLDDPRRLGWLAVYMSHYLWITGHPAEARSRSQEAQAIAQALADGPLTIAASLYLGFSCHRLGEYREAKDSLRRVVRSLEGESGRDFLGLSASPAVLSRWTLVRSLAERGEFDEGIGHGREAIRIAEALDHPYSLILACQGGWRSSMP